MITGNQIRAARALINMSQDELAGSAGLTPQAIRKIESGTVTPREGTISDITKVFDEKRLEFIEHNGVRFKPRQLEVFEGNEDFKRFMNDIYETARTQETEICISGVEESVFVQHLGQSFTEMHIARMTALKKNNVRCLIGEGDADLYCDSYNEYRWVPAELFSAVPFYVYGNKFAVVLFEDKNVMVIVIESEPVAKAYRKQFELIWAKSNPLTAQNSEKGS